MVEDQDLTNSAERLLLDALGWLGETYGDRVFYVERDIVYAVQTRLHDLIDAETGPWRLYNDYPMVPGPRRSLLPCPGPRTPAHGPCP